MLVKEVHACYCLHLKSCKEKLHRLAFSLRNKNMGLKKYIHKKVYGECCEDVSFLFVKQSLTF